MYEYKILEGEEHPLFYFKTDFGSQYQVIFQKAGKVVDFIEVYFISVMCMSDGKHVKDLKVGATVNNIITEFIQDYSEAIFSYVCESDDDREVHRQRKFLGWYESYKNENYTLRPYEIEVPELEVTYYTSIIFDNKQYDSEFIDHIYETEVRELTAAKG